MKSVYHLRSKSVTEMEKSDQIGESSLPGSSLVEEQTSLASGAFKEEAVKQKESISKEVTITTWIRLKIKNISFFRKIKL